MLCKILIIAGLLAPQTHTPDPQIALIVRNETVIVKKSEAKLLQKSEDPHVRAAAEIALIAEPEVNSAPPAAIRERVDWEILRGVRAPLQGKN